MRFFSTIFVALRALRRNKLRSILTALGIIIGVGAVIAMVSIGNGAQAQVEAQVASLGQNIIMVFAGSATNAGARSGYGGAGTLTVEDAQAIEVRGPRRRSAVSPEVRAGVQVLANGLNWGTQHPAARARTTWPCASGRSSDGAMFTEQDVRSDAKVCVIGQTIVNNLFPDGEPIGKTIRIRNLPFKVARRPVGQGLLAAGHRPGRHRASSPTRAR